LEVEVLAGPDVGKLLADGKGVHREGGGRGAEGSRRQSPDPRNTNRIPGYIFRTSLREKAKLIAIKMIKRLQEAWVAI
jgi:hypothetical protein